MYSSRIHCFIHTSRMPVITGCIQCNKDQLEIFMTKRTKILLIFLAAFIGITFFLLSLFSQSRFLKYCNDFFQEEMSSSALTLHYTIADPEKYGIKCPDISLGSFDQNLTLRKWQLFRRLFTLKTISRDQLSSDLQRTYDLLKYSLHTELSRLDYSLLEEPLVPAIGIQSACRICFSFRSGCH